MIEKMDQKVQEQKHAFIVETDFGSFLEFDSKWSNLSDAFARVLEIISNLNDSEDWQVILEDKEEKEIILSNDKDFIRVAICPKEFFQ